MGDHSQKEEAMKYMLLIHQGDTPTPRDPEAWGKLPEDEQKAVFADLIGILGDFDLAEEAAQEAFAIAAARWPRDGAPSSPRGWLVTTARNRATDRIRRDRTLAAKAHLFDLPEAVEDDPVDATP